MWLRIVGTERIKLVKEPKEQSVTPGYNIKEDILEQGDHMQIISKDTIEEKICTEYDSQILRGIDCRVITEG